MVLCHCPSCGEIVEHELLTGDDESYWWCQECLRLRPATESERPPPENVGQAA